MKIFSLLLISCSLCLSACSSNKSSQPLPEGSVQAASANASKQWHCEGNSQGEWQCHDLADAAMPAPTAVVTAPQAAVLATTPVIVSPVAASPTIAGPVVTDAIVTDPIITSPAAPSGYSLQAYPSNYYAVQLIAAQKQVTIDYYLRKNPQLSPHRVSVMRNNQRWQLLILGVYPSRQEAAAAVNAITPALTDKPWIRSLAPLQASLLEPDNK